jgi:hypothetical protein
VLAGLTCPMYVLSSGSRAWTSRPSRYHSSSVLTAKACLLCGIPHNRHYVDGGVMCPVGAFVLVGAVRVVFSGA